MDNLAFICPITKDVMTDPVIAQDGHTYERSAIKELFSAGRIISPLIREPISTVLITNHSMRSELSIAGYPIKSLIKQSEIRNSVKITLVLDVSGSMDTSVENKTNEPSFSRLDLIKHSVNAIGNMMSESDELSIIAFNESAKMIMPWTKMNSTGKELNRQIAFDLKAGGCTNILAGLLEGIYQNGNDIILLTDGANTTNPSLRTTLGEYIVDHLTNYTGKIHSVGLGMDQSLDTPTLRTISSSTGGFYCFCPDSSMVGTIFIHLMANICVNEPGLKFDNYDSFLATIINAFESRDIDIIRKTKFNNMTLTNDLVSLDPNKGQVEKSLMNWDTWGRHYLPAFIDSHLHCMTTNFKDGSLQGYATPATRDFIDAGEAIFLKIVPPTPSCNNYYNTRYTQQQFTQNFMSQEGACFSSNTALSVYNRGLQSMINISDIRKGMMVSTVNGLTTVKCLVISPRTEMVYVINPRDGLGFWVSRKHPLRYKDKWEYAEYYSFGKEVEMHKCYNLVLESGHLIYTNGYAALTLGHSKKGSVVEHDYLGTNRVIEDLEKAPGWDKGIVTLTGLIRNENGICGILYN